MQKDCTIRICSTCNKPLPWSTTESGQSGYVCCDEYYCSDVCVDKSFPGQETFAEHFTEDGDCYYTDWELEEVE